MPFELTKLKLRTTTAGVMVTAIALIAFIFTWPVDTSVPPDATARLLATATTLATTEPTSNSVTLSNLLDVVLRRPLVDHPATTAPSVGNSLLGLRLIGTIIEPLHSYAVLTEGGGSSLVKSVGDRAGGAVVFSINPDSVTLQLNGRSVVLHTLKPPTIGASGT